jgi:hypothetical protein
MAMTLVEAAKLSNDVLVKGVIETTVKDSPILQRLPFAEINGNALTYNRENAMATVDWFDVGDTWNESTPTFTQLSSTLKILGGDADVDKYLQQTRSNIQDLKAAVIELKSKALRHEFEDTFIYGNATTNPKEFSGLAKLIDTATASSQLIAAGATGATLTLAMVDQLIDAVKGGPPDMLLMSKRSRRKITALVRALGGAQLGYIKDGFGALVATYNDIPIGVSDWILDTHTLLASVETAYTGDTSSTIYALQFGEGKLMGIQNQGIQVEEVGALETKDATRTRIKWYCGLCDYSVVARAALIGVKD